MEHVRSFIAIELPDEVKAGLTRLQDRLKADKHSSVKWVNPNSIHLTLKFLGDVTVNKLNEISKAMETAVQEIPPFQLEVKDLGVFPNLNKVRVVWVGVRGDITRLGQLQQRLESNLATLDFTPETRVFTPHLTLARLREQASPDERQNFGQLIGNTKFESVYKFRVDSISLMRSQLTREGAIYSRLSSAKLKQPLSTATN